MNEQDFDKKIGDTLRINKEFVPGKEQWTKMNHLLNQTKTKNRLLLLPWFITAITAIVGGSYITHLNHKMNHLQHEIDNAQTADEDRSNIHLITDTCFSEIELIKKNIIIKNIYKTNYVGNNINVANNIGAKENDIITRAKFVDHSDVLQNSKQSYPNQDSLDITSNSEKNLTEKNNLAPINGSQLSNSEPIINTNNKGESTSQINNNDNIKNHENNSHADKNLINKSLDSLEKIEKKHFIEMNKKSTSKPFKIKSFEIGILAGYAGSKPRAITKQYGYISGLQANILFQNKFSVSANIEYINLTFEHNSYEGTDLPKLNPPGPNDILTDITVIKPYFNYILGLRYSPFSWGIKPYIGLGLAGLINLEPTTNYQFKNLITQEESNIITNTYSRYNDFPNFNLCLGLEYPVFYPLIWKLEGSYILHANKSYKDHPLYYIKTGVAIRF